MGGNPVPRTCRGSDTVPDIRLDRSGPDTGFSGAVRVGAASRYVRPLT